MYKKKGYLISLPVRLHQLVLSLAACWRFPGCPVWLHGGDQYIHPPPKQQRHEQIMKSILNDHLKVDIYVIQGTNRHSQCGRHRHHSGSGSGPLLCDCWWSLLTEESSGPCPEHQPELQPVSAKSEIILNLTHKAWEGFKILNKIRRMHSFKFLCVNILSELYFRV